MTLITDWYVREQQVLHFEHAHAKKYGSGGPQFAGLINGICMSQNIHEVLDYGCGKAVLAKAISPGISYQGYDPAIEEHAALPRPSDMVVCLDVLEHVEPECLHDVLAHLALLTKRLLFVSISMRQAQSGRFLSDGRNTHLIIEDEGWWRDKIVQHEFCEMNEYKTPVKEFVALFGRGA